MKFEWVHDFSVVPKQYWEIFFAEDFSKDLYKRLPLRSYKRLEQKEEDQGNVLRRVQLVEPSVPIPRWASSLVPSVVYRETHLLHRARSMMEIFVEPVHMRERFSFHAAYEVSPLGEEKCRQKFFGEVQIRAPLLGTKLEAFFVDQLAESERTIIAVTEEWIDRLEKKP